MKFRRGSASKMTAVTALATTAFLMLIGCGASGSGATTSTAEPSTGSTGSGQGSTSASQSAGTVGSALSGKLTIFAAASLKKTFDQLRNDFVAQNPGVSVAEIAYDGSSTLATQLVNGAAADVFASADDKNMTTVSKAGLIAGAPVEFATNTLEIAVAPGNPKQITGLAGLTGAGLDVVLCAPQVPCGAAAHTALTAAGVNLTPRSEEQNVTAVLTKVKSGDADAGLVYRTDVLGSGNAVTGVPFPEAAKAVNHYPIAALSGSKNGSAAAAFIALVTDATGRKVLSDAGFGAP